MVLIGFHPMLVGLGWQKEMAHADADEYKNSKISLPHKAPNFKKIISFHLNNMAKITPYPQPAHL